MSINDATPQDWDRVRETGEPTFEEYQKRLKFSWVHDGTKPAAQTAYAEDVDLFGDCWDVKELTLDEQMQVYLDAAAEEELDSYDENGYALKVSKEDVDAVNNPSHYNTGSVECIEAIEESMSADAFRGYLKGNCMKYLWRYSYKGKSLEDVQKAQWYLSKLAGALGG